MINRRLAPVLLLKNWLKDNVSAEIDINFEAPPKLEGQASFDVAIPCFLFARHLKKAPMLIADEIAEQLKPHLDQMGFESAQAVTGFVNLRLKKDKIEALLAERFDHPFAEASGVLSGQRVLLEYSSPNIAKPFSIGHLRTTNIGAALSRIYQALGAEIIRVNHLGDWGTQFGKLITAYKRFGNADFVKGDAINNLYHLYVKFHEEEKNDPALLDEAREWFVKLENGDEEATELWSWFKDVSYQEFKRIYDRLGVEFDYVTGESFYRDLMKESITRLEEKNLLEESDGALVVNFEDETMPPCLVKKTDGSTLYATRDIATAEYRADTFQPHKMLYVVGGEQRLHFRQVFKVIEKMGHPWSSVLEHVDFGLIKFPSGKMSTRKGNIIRLEDVLDKAVEKVREIIDKKEGERGEAQKLSDKEKKEISEIVGTGAIIFFDLKAKRRKDVNFDWDEILSFEGDSGPYLQYSAVRISAILNRAKESASQELLQAGSKLGDTEAERALAMSIMNFPAQIESAARDNEPSHLSHALLELAGDFNRFYAMVRVLGGDAEFVSGRLKLLELTHKCLECGLGLLGIRCPQKM